ncbi:sugar ABC transporter permease [Streptococcus pneumoniae]|nr:sugar ABC transporter permease [Streptococcus pneumoniae]
MSKKLQQISVPLISVFLGILLGAIVMWIFGYDAIWGYEELFYTAFGSLRGIGEIFRAMGPLVLIGLGFAVASRAGFFNVGLPGQALAGLGGAVEGLGTFQNVYVQGSSLAIGFNGMAVSLLAANSPIGILFAAFLFGVLQVGAPGMNAAQVPSELVSIVTASIIFFVSVHYLIERFVKPKKQVKGGK